MKDNLFKNAESRERLNSAQNRGVVRRKDSDYSAILGFLSIAITVCILLLALCTVFMIVSKASETDEGADKGDGGQGGWLWSGKNVSEYILQFGFPAFTTDKQTTGGISSGLSSSESSHGVTKETTGTSVKETEKNIYEYDPDAVPEGAVAVVPMDISLMSFGNNFIYNDTDHYPDIEDLTNRKDSVAAGADISSREPLVLIIHSHGTESYGDGSPYRYEGDDCRSTDINKNVIAVGEVLAQTLRDYGINTLHSTKLHDDISYSGAYSLSAETVSSYLQKYPSIRYVFDIHRDSIDTAKGHSVRSVCEVDGESVAQIMAVIGSDSNGTSYDSWEDNLAFSVNLRRRMNSTYGNIFRPTYLKRKSYNQELVARSILFEIGTEGNTLDEACRAAKLLGKELSQMITQK